MTAAVSAKAAKARALVRLRDGRIAVLIHYPHQERGAGGVPSGRARVRVGGRYETVQAEDVVELAPEGAVPAWVTHERLTTLVRLLAEQGAPGTNYELVTLQAHVPHRREELCRGCGEFWPCASAVEVGDRRGFFWG